MTLLQNQPVVSLSRPDDNSCSISCGSVDRQEPVRISARIPASAPAKLPTRSKKKAAPQKIQASLDNLARDSARAQAIARMTRILSTDRAMTRTAPVYEAPGKVTA